MSTTSHKRSVLIDVDSNGEPIDIPVSINIREVADIIYSYGQDLRACRLEPDPGEDKAYGDIRIQVHDGAWYAHTGDAQYDQDHRGLWGSASVPVGVSRKHAREIAIDLLADIS